MNLVARDKDRIKDLRGHIHELAGETGLEIQEIRKIVHMVQKGERGCRQRRFCTTVEDAERPREFHPEPLTDSGRDTLASSGSCHRAKAAAFR
jgi:hypothetical protein